MDAVNGCIHPESTHTGDNNMTLPKNLYLLIFSCLCFFVMPGFAQDNAEHQSSSGKEQEQASTDEQPPAGQVIIKGEDKERISEFRINGQLYMIRVTPKKGVPYYLVDGDGDGNLETRWNELAPDLLIPSWVLLRW